MSMNDVLSDMIARIKNGQQATLASVSCPASNLLEAVLKVLEAEGYIRGYKREVNARGQQELVIDLKYFEGEPVIKKFVRVSSPGRRQYSSIKRLPRVHNGLGISILSTSKGVMSDQDARSANIGGEVLAKVF